MIISPLRKRITVVLLVIAALPAPAAIYLGLRFMHIRSEAEQYRQQVRKARDEARGNAWAFMTEADAAPRRTVRQLVSAAAGKHGVTANKKGNAGMIKLDHNSKPLGERLSQELAVAELVQVPHDRLVRFLIEIEGAGTGETVRELRLLPARDREGFYTRVNVTVTRIVDAEQP